jgi:hypothetical protein
MSKGPGAMPTEDTEKIVDDCQVLLGHVTRLPDTRLDWCFEETRAVIAGSPPARVAMPPLATREKAVFLKRLVELGCRPRSEDGIIVPARPEDVAFLIASRDFLSSLAWPATVDSIRISEEYNRTGGIGRVWAGVKALWSRLRHGAPKDPPVPDSNARRFGRGLATQVVGAHCLVLFLVALTVTISVYALIGRGLIQEVRSNDAFFGKLSADMDAAEKADAPIFLSRLGIGEDGPRRGTGGQEAPPAHSVLRYCEAAQWRGTSDPTDRFVTRQQQKLCDRYNGYNDTITRLFVRLQDWHGSHLPGTRDRLRPAPEPDQRLADASGRSITSIREVVRSAALEDAQRLRLEVATATVVLQAIAEYLLPCLYAVLGALAAALRHIARRADEATLDFSDGGVIMRTLVLGLLFGAVIGLFASQLSGASSDNPAVASLTPAAISLLAGYSVARVFEFLDGVSVRVFGPRPAPASTG